jgi:hypothetical protein
MITATVLRLRTIKMSVTKDVNFLGISRPSRHHFIALLSPKTIIFQLKYDFTVIRDQNFVIAIRFPISIVIEI